MKYVSIDIETTGIDPTQSQLIEIAMIVDDTTKPTIPVQQLPTYHKYVKHDQYYGNVGAICMNERIFELLNDDVDKDIIHVNDLVRDMYEFLKQNHIILEKNENKNHVETHTVVPAGKNFASFDKLFIEKLPHFDDKLFHFSYRVLDPATAFLRFEDSEIPDSECCANRSYTEFLHNHHAVDDANSVIEQLRFIMNQNDWIAEIN